MEKLLGAGTIFTLFAVISASTGCASSTQRTIWRNTLPTDEPQEFRLTLLASSAEVHTGERFAFAVRLQSYGMEPVEVREPMVFTQKRLEAARMERAGGAGEEYVVVVSCVQERPGVDPFVAPTHGARSVRVSGVPVLFAGELRRDMLQPGRFVMQAALLKGDVEVARSNQWSVRVVDD